MKNKKMISKGSFFGSKKMSITLIFVLEIMLIFTFLDYLAHSISTSYAVPASYFGSEIIYGTIFAFFAYLFVKSKKLTEKSFTFSAIMAVGIQLVYLSLGYPLSFVLTFLIINFALMFVVSYFWMKVKRM